MRTILTSVLLLASAALASSAVAPEDGARAAAMAATDLSSQGIPPRARTRIRVTPARKLVRECDFRLAREVRASGTYVVPLERCWWALR